MKKILLIAFMLSSALISESWAQDRTIKGKVTSEEGTLPGVSILVKGSTQGTITDIDGNYSLSVPDGAVLAVSYVGHLPQEIEVGSRNVIDIIMEYDAKQLSEVVVTAVGIERNAKDLSYSVATVGAEDLNAGRANNVLGALQGKIPGAQILVNSGNPGASTSIVLRGTATFNNGSGNALIVIDGVPMINSQLRDVQNQAAQNGNNFFTDNTDGGNGISDIDPENIESVTVLKGISASALYGSTAANGAIIITTKSGKGSTGGLSSVSYNGNFSWDTPMRLPPIQTQFGLGQFGNNLEFINDQETWGDAYDGSLRPWSQIVDNQQLYKRYVATPATLRAAFDTGHTFRHNVNLQGGSGDASYFASYTYADQKGIVPGSGQKKHNLKLTGRSKLSNNITISGSSEFVTSKKQGTPQGTGGNSDASFYGNLLRTSADIPTTESRDFENKYQDVAGYFTPFNANPFRSAYTWEDITDVNRVFGNLTISYKPLDWLTVTARLGADHVDRKLEQYRPVEISGPPNSINRQGTFRVLEATNDLINTDFLVQISKPITEDLKITGLLAHNYRNTFGSTNSGTQPILGIPGFRSLTNGSSVPLVDATFTQRRVIGIYGSAGVSYKDIYHLEVLGRNDQSSTLPAANNSFFYYSVSGNVILSELVNVNFLSSLKIRAAYTEVGNDAPAYRTNNTFLVDLDADVNSGRAADFPFINAGAQGGGTVVGATANDRVGAPDLKPERTTGYEIGIEAGLFDERIGIDFTYYNQLSKDQIFDVSVSSASGFQTATTNAGAIRNSGVEIQLNIIPVELDDFTVSTTLNFTKNKAIAESLAPGIDKFTFDGFSSGGAATNIIAQPGEKIYLWEYTDYLKDPNGNLVVSPTTGLPQLDNSGNITDGRTWQADFTMGIVNNVRWKNLSLTVNLDWRQGGYFFSETFRQLQNPGKSQSTTYNNRMEWIVPGSVLDNGDGTFSPNTSVFIADPNQYWNNRNTGDFLITSTFVKLRELSLSYTLPSSLLDNIFVNRASITVYGRNLWIWTPAENPYADPEQAQAFGVGQARTFPGFEFGQIPSLRNMGVSLNVNF